MINLQRKLAKNFKLEEFLTSKFFDEDVQKRVIQEYLKDKDVQESVVKLSKDLQVVRDYVGVPVNINISYRPVFYEKLNDRDGTSQHCLGKAADITIEGYTPEQVTKLIQKLMLEGKISKGGLSTYSTFTHYDIRGFFVTW